jgi:hypothetical protein
LERLKNKIKKKRLHLKKKKSAVSSRHCTGSQISDHFSFADHKKMLAGKKFSTNEEVISGTEAYFETKEKSYYKNGIEKLLLQKSLVYVYLSFEMNRNNLKRVMLQVVLFLFQN